MQAYGKDALALLAAAALLLAGPPSADAGFGLSKAKETKTSFVCGGEKISVWQFTPTEGTGPFPGIVMLYGLEGLDDLARVLLLYKMVAGQIAEKGYVVHFVLYFERSKIAAQDVQALKTDMRKELLNPNKDKPNQQCEDYYRSWMGVVKDAVLHLRKNPAVQADRIGLVGFSMGGFLATSTVVEHLDLKVRVVVNAFSGLPERQQALVRKAKQKLPPILILAGEDDDIVPEKFSRDLLTLWRETDNKAEAHFYSGVGHMFFDKSLGGINTEIALKEALPTAIRFLNRNLAAPKMEKK